MDYSNHFFNSLVKLDSARAAVRPRCAGSPAAPATRVSALETREADVPHRTMTALSFGMRQSLAGSFSAVSKPNFERKYAFESSRRDLHNVSFAQL